jgi:hypothetical protein
MARCGLSPGAGGEESISDMVRSFLARDHVARSQLNALTVPQILDAKDAKDAKGRKGSKGSKGSKGDP